MSNLTVANLSAPASAGNRISVPAPNVLYAPGHIIQVLNTTLYTPTAVSIPNNATGNTNIPDFACTITPKSTSSRIYVQVRWFGELSPQTSNWDTMFGLKRNGVAVGVNPNTAGGATGISMAALGYYLSDANSTPEMMFFDFFDSPASTSALTYQVYANTTGSTPTIFTNRTVAAAAASYEYGSSTITLWEIAA
jgi:hypothetical protein